MRRARETSYQKEGLVAGWGNSKLGAVLLSLLCGACTHIEIVGDAEVRRESAMKVSVTPGPSGRLLVSRLTGAGVIAQDSGVTLGLLSQTQVIAGGQCQVVVLAERESQLRNIEALLQQQSQPLSGLCVGSLRGKP
jgi:hypothetical protein